MKDLKENIKKLEKELAEMKAKLEQQEQQIQYPIFCKSLDSNLVVRFDDLQRGEVVV